MHEATESWYKDRIWLPVPSPAPGPDEDGLLIVNLVSKQECNLKLTNNNRLLRLNYNLLSKRSKLR